VSVPAVTVTFAVTVQLAAPVLVEQAAADASPGMSRTKPVARIATAAMPIARQPRVSDIDLVIALRPLPWECVPSVDIAEGGHVALSPARPRSSAR
jgi:hypothetical protein